MPLGDTAAGVLLGAMRVIGSFLFDVLFEILIKGAGYALIKTFRPQSEPSETSCGVVGLVFWAALIGVGFIVYRQAVAA